MLKCSILILLIITCIPWQSTRAEVYRWKDKNGKIHFSDKPHTDATQLDIKAVKPAGIGSSNEQIQRQKELLDSFQRKRETRQQQALQDKKHKAAVDNYCRGLKNRLKNYTDADYLYTRDEAGEKQHLSDQQKQKEIEKLRAEIAERC